MTTTDSPSERERELVLMQWHTTITINSALMIVTIKTLFGNCAFVYQGGCWHDDCAFANLNSRHTLPSTRGVSSNTQLAWNDGIRFQDLSAVKMKI